MLIVLAVLSLAVFAVPPRYKYWFTLLVVAAGAAVSTALALSAWGASAGEIVFESGYSPLFLFDRPVMDGLSAVFVIVASVVAVSVTVYAKDYLAAYRESKSPAQMSLHYAALSLLYFSMVFVLTYRGGFAFLFSWELMTLSSFLLVLFEGEKREVRRAAINYLVLMHVGFVFLLTGFVLGSGGGDAAGFDALRNYFATHDPVPLFLLFFGGFGMKAGLFPLHVWLPEAHPAAPAHVSALMSGVMLKMGVYGVMRVLTYVEAGELYTIGLIVLFAGVVTALWGIVFAALQNDLKRLLACSSMENVGLIFTGLGAGMVGRATGNDVLALLGTGGALLHAVNHAFFKSVLFLNAGSVYLKTHTRNLDELGGLSKRMPVTSLLFLVGTLAICALPPFNGFVSEFLIYAGFFRSVAAGTDVLLAAVGIATLSLVGGLVVLVFTKAYGIGFLGMPRSRRAAEAKEAGNWMIGAQVLPLAGILLIGLVPAFVSSRLTGVVSSVYSLPEMPAGTDGLAHSLAMISVLAAVLIGMAGGIYVWKRRLLRGRTVAEFPTWGCGFTAPDARMQYTAESYAEGLQRLSSPLTGRSAGETGVSKDEPFAGTVPNSTGRWRDRVDSLVSGRWVFLVRKLNARLGRFQTGRVNHYVLHAVVFLAAVFLLTLLGIL